MTPPDTRETALEQLMVYARILGVDAAFEKALQEPEASIREIEYHTAHLAKLAQYKAIQGSRES